MIVAFSKIVNVCVKIPVYYYTWYILRITNTTVLSISYDTTVCDESIFDRGQTTTTTAKIRVEQAATASWV